MGGRNLRSGLLLDTHILVRWFTEPDRLSKDQDRAIRHALGQNELVNVSTATLIELASILGRGSKRSPVSADVFFDALEADSGFCIVPVNIEIGRETAALGGSLRDLWDRAIVATARIHGLRLVTSDQTIIDSNLVSVVE